MILLIIIMLESFDINIMNFLIYRFNKVMKNENNEWITCERNIACRNVNKFKFLNKMDIAWKQQYFIREINVFLLDTYLLFINIQTL